MGTLTAYAKGDRQALSNTGAREIILSVSRLPMNITPTPVLLDLFTIEFTTVPKLANRYNVERGFPMWMPTARHGNHPESHCCGLQQIRLLARLG